MELLDFDVMTIIKPSAEVIRQMTQKARKKQSQVKTEPLVRPKIEKNEKVIKEERKHDEEEEAQQKPIEKGKSKKGIPLPYQMPKAPK